MVDVLTGAAAFCWNGGMSRDSRRSVGMKELVAVIQKSYGRKLGENSKPSGQFVIWKFIPGDYDGPSSTAPGEVINYP